MAGLVFALAAAFLLYVLAGYPLLLAWLAARRGRAPTISNEFHSLPVTVLLPARNGGPWLAAKLRSILALDYPRELLQILVISNGSSDDTEAIARQFAPQGVELISLAGGGKAAALNAGMRRATGDILFFTDVRQRLDPAALKELAGCFADPAVGVASGELFIDDGSTIEEGNVGLYWRYEKWIRKNLSRLDSVLGATGCIYAMRRELAVELPEDTLLDDVHLPLAAFFRGYRVVLHESAKAFDVATSLDQEFRRKVRTLAGVYQLLGRYPALLGPANRMWIHFVSHKLGRLLLPFALIALAASSFWLPGPWGVAALAAQAGLYLLAAMDLAAPEGSLLKRLSSPVRTFVVLMAAALAALSYFFLPARSFWKETGARRAES
jgi:cellulose synthase/poly-beta-1,6-N-acetylglucosamine synthase-like glycosyltransferase